MQPINVFCEHAKSRIPGMTQLLSKRPDMFSLGVWPTYYSKAKGAHVQDLDGRDYLDMSLGGIGACALGYADEEVDEAVIRAIRDGVACSLNSPEEVLLADALCQAHPWAEQVRFARSGGEALSMAVRIARAHTDREKIAVCGYHGWCDWYLAANLGSEKSLDGHLLPGLAPSGVPSGLRGTALTFHYNALDELERIVKEHGGELAAIVMEPIRSAMPHEGFIEGVRRLADTCGAVLIMDEVSAAFRFCAGGAHMVLHGGVQPDMAVFAKALGNGYAISAIIGKRFVMDSAQKTFISSTNWTERVGYAAGLACLKAHQRRTPFEKFARLGVQIKEGWQRAAAEHGFTLHVDGMDAMAHFSLDVQDFAAAKAYFVQCMLDKGILASNLCYLMDSHTQEDVEHYLAACAEVFALLREAVDTGTLAARLRGKPAASGFARLA